MAEKYGDYKLLPKFGNKDNGFEQFGSGGFAKVYLAENENEKDNKKIYVIKVLKDEIKKGNKESFNKEIDIIEKLPKNKYTPWIYCSHKYSLENEKKIKNDLNENKNDELAYYAIDLFSNYILYYYVTLNKLLEKRTTKLMFKKIVEGVQFLHNNNICHLDLKPENIILDKDFEPIIIDFGYSGKIKDEDGEYIIYKDIRGSDHYRCPQMWEKDIKYKGVETDVFSLGIILFNLVTGRYGFGSYKSNYKYYGLIKEGNGDYTNYWNIFNLNLSDNFKNLYIKMVAYNPSERPSIEEILKSAWLGEITGLEEKEQIKLEEEYRERFSKICEKIKINRKNDEKAKEIKLIEDIKKLGYITRFDENVEYNLFQNKKLKAKKIFNDNIHVNFCIEINEDISIVKFMNYLIMGICKILKGDCLPSEDRLRIEIYFEEKEEFGSCTMEIELFEYEKGRYLLELKRIGGEIPDYYHYCVEINKLVINIIDIS